jgi:hypothetical protein
MSAAIPTLPAINSLILGTDAEGRTVSLPVKPAEKVAFLGVSGSGKSFCAALMCEQWLKAGVPVCVIDPVGIHWGLRSGADGKPEGGLEIPVYGGEHGDDELPSPIIAAQAFALESRSMVLDVSECKMEELHEFCASFFEEIMAPGCKPVRPCRILLEEAPVLAPQTGSLSKHNRRCKAALAHLARVGRNRGIGLDIISQRAASVDKTLLTQAGNLILLRLAASIDRRAITEWCASNSAELDPKEVLAYLAEAENGEGMLWAPTWLKDRPRNERYLKIKVGRRETFHPGPDAQEAAMLPITLPGASLTGDFFGAVGALLKFTIKAALILGGLWLAWKILSVLAAVVGLALLLWIVFGK